MKRFIMSEKLVLIKLPLIKFRIKCFCHSIAISLHDYAGFIFIYRFNKYNVKRKIVVCFPIRNFLNTENQYIAVFDL